MSEIECHWSSELKSRELSFEVSRQRLFYLENEKEKFQSQQNVHIKENISLRSKIAELEDKIKRQENYMKRTHLKDRTNVGAPEMLGTPSACAKPINKTISRNSLSTKFQSNEL